MLHLYPPQQVGSGKAQAGRQSRERASCCLALIFLSLINIFILPVEAQAQISPPGLSNTRLAMWGAVGINQRLTPRWSSTTYYGVSRASDPDNWALLKKTGIQVLNQEFLFQASRHWQVSLAASFRRQNEYQKEAPYETEDPAYRYEIRYYSRFYFRHQLKKVAMTYTFRPEFRRFYQPSWESWPAPTEVRLRLKAQASLPLNSAKTNFLISGNEILSAFNKQQDGTWTSLRFTEDRFTIFFRHIFQKPSLVVDIGLMEQARKASHDPRLHFASYLAFDIMLQDPFSRH